MTRSNRPDHIRLTSHPEPGGIPRFPINWGAPSAHEQGPIIGLFAMDTLQTRSLCPAAAGGRTPRQKPQPMTADELMTTAQAATLKRLAEAAYELDAFKPNLTRTEADIRIAMLTAKLKLLDGPPHTL